MARQQEASKEIRLKVAGRQLEFLESRTKELGLSSEAELLRWYVISDMAKAIEETGKEQKGTARAMLKHSGKWAGGDSEQIIKLIEETRAEAEF